MTRRLNLIGQVFDRLTVLEFAGTVRYKSAWLCQCNCGQYITVRGDALTTGNTKSCGCEQHSAGKNANAFKHGHAASDNKKSSPEYNSWAGMLQRCYDPNHNRFEHYGGRGIVVCERWRDSFENFLADVGERPEPKDSYSIDRYPNPDGDYEPSNCRWATDSEQMKNRRPLKQVSFVKHEGIFNSMEETQ